jgi:hypothetical protein
LAHALSSEDVHSLTTRCLIHDVASLKATQYFINLGQGENAQEGEEDEILRFPSLAVFIATLMTDSDVGDKIDLPVAITLQGV